MRAPDRHEDAGVTEGWRKGIQPQPLEDRHFVPVEELQDALRGIGPIDPREFFEDIDFWIDPTPRDWFDE